LFLLIKKNSFKAQIPTINFKNSKKLNYTSSLKKYSFFKADKYSNSKLATRQILTRYSVKKMINLLRMDNMIN